jgi:asparagine synthase (glutamine-hydrolysing)
LPSYYYILKNNFTLKKVRYWNLEKNSKIYTKDDIKNLLIDSIKLRLRADVKIGALLSGGVDSSVLVGMMDKKLNIKNLETFSAIFKGYEQYSEEYLIKKNIEMLNIKNHLVDINYKEIEQELDKLFRIQEIPIRSLSIYAQYKLYKYIKNNTDIKVVINGQGADEIFSGYSDHIYYYKANNIYNLDLKNAIKEIKIYSYFSKKTTLEIIKQVVKIIILRSKLKKFFQFYSKYSLPKSHIKYKNYFRDIFLDKLYHDLTFSALKEYLHYDDRNSMYFSLESRLPYLDYRLVEAVYNLSNEEKINRGITKKILRKIGKNYVHRDIINNRIKQGFVSPQEYWQKKELKFLLDEGFKEIKANNIFNFLNGEMLYKYYESYQNNKFNDWTFIWRIFALYKWKNTWKVEDE